MKPIQYGPDTHDLCVSMLEHDPKMLTYIENASFDIIKSVLDKSLSYSAKISFNTIDSAEVKSRILSYIYSKNKRYKKDIIEFIHREWNENSSNEKLVVIPVEYKELYKKVIKDYPIYLLMTEIKHLDSIFKNFNEPLDEYVKSIDIEKSIKQFLDIVINVSKDEHKDSTMNNKIRNEVQRLFGDVGTASIASLRYGYFRSNEGRIQDNDFFDHLVSFKERFSIESSNLSALLMTLKL
jgi:hypothetical protein